MDCNGLPGSGWLVIGDSPIVGSAIASDAARLDSRVVVCCTAIRNVSDGPSGEAAPDPAVADNLVVLERDLTSEEDVDALFDEIVDFLPSLSVVIVSVSDLPRSLPPPLTDMSRQDWDDAIEDPLRRAFLVARRAVGDLLAQGDGGRVVFVELGSQSTLIGETRRAALRSLTRSIAKEYGQKGIIANLVVASLDPRSTDSPDRNALQAIVAAVLFLASTEASFVTGEELAVAGT